MEDYLKIKWIQNSIFFLFIGISSSLVWVDNVLDANFGIVAALKVFGLIVLGFVTNILITAFVGLIAMLIASFLFEQESVDEQFEQKSKKKDSNSYFDKFYLFMIFTATTNIIIYSTKAVTLFTFFH
ncbi:MAG TPA: hypothetical protein VF676_12695 [Flavobacterium sp.]|jgi:hypothetical protein